jgi:hypothetical protein
MAGVRLSNSSSPIISRGILDLGLDFPAPFVGRRLFDVEINAAVFHHWRWV